MLYRLNIVWMKSKMTRTLHYGSSQKLFWKLCGGLLYFLFPVTFDWCKISEGQIFINFDISFLVCPCILLSHSISTLSITLKTPILWWHKQQTVSKRSQNNRTLIYYTTCRLQQCLHLLQNIIIVTVFPRASEYVQIAETKLYKLLRLHFELLYTYSLRQWLSDPLQRWNF